ncbi:MAG: hypothetical protein WC632_06920 [Candidatus Margulisiibacteriota bacterium]
MTSKTLEFFLEMLRIGNRAVKIAQDKNRKKGIANVYVKHEKIYFELPNGKITTVSPF